ncbi:MULTISPECIES: Gfo/Idh/MocA family oxidoreductase [Alkalimonas]|uniref:Dehydrogenase n=1 Tax=Alkalimonas mucilaginosa TaxID=3057676 RepID=A0ABU7JBG5_9GAMM|nr:dehydrogenase [Alkalimonas sp. MEB004]MEE2023029.1 dehydrogenase [Alkalimonas sp. MEB004]
MHKLLIIGAGQLGSRHLQGALLSTGRLNITVVDPSLEALSIAEDRSRQIEWGNKDSQICYKTVLPELQYFDVCIIATAANVRADVTKTLLVTQKNLVNHIIFEKVLFQRIDDYSTIQSLLKDLKIKSWVNCPRRIFPTYQELRSFLDLNMPIHMTVTGNSWGMACNSIHFIDLFTFLIGNTALQVGCIELDAGLIESKRAGNYEITGSIELTAGNHSLKIVCGQELDCCLEVKVENGNSIHLINEIDKSWLCNKGSDSERRAYTPLLQSQLTGSVVADLITSDQCQLTPLTESCAIHIPFINVVLDHISKQLGIQLDACLIT